MKGKNNFLVIVLAAIAVYFFARNKNVSEKKDSNADKKLLDAIGGMAAVNLGEIAVLQPSEYLQTLDLMLLHQYGNIREYEGKSREYVEIYLRKIKLENGFKVDNQGSNGATYGGVGSLDKFNINNTIM